MGHQEAEHRFNKLLSCLSHPPSYTCVRASTHLAPLEEIRQQLAEELRKVGLCLVTECRGRKKTHTMGFGIWLQCVGVVLI